MTKKEYIEKLYTYTLYLLEEIKQSEDEDIIDVLEDVNSTLKELVDPYGDGE